MPSSRAIYSLVEVVANNLSFLARSFRITTRTRLRGGLVRRSGLLTTISVASVSVGLSEDLLLPIILDLVGRGSLSFIFRRVFTRREIG